MFLTKKLLCLRLDRKQHSAATASAVRTAGLLGNPALEEQCFGLVACVAQLEGVAEMQAAIRRHMPLQVLASHVVALVPVSHNAKRSLRAGNPHLEARVQDLGASPEPYFVAGKNRVWSPQAAALEVPCSVSDFPPCYLSAGETGDASYS